MNICQLYLLNTNLTSSLCACIWSVALSFPLYWLMFIQIKSDRKHNSVLPSFPSQTIVFPRSRPTSKCHCNTNISMAFFCSDDNSPQQKYIAQGYFNTLLPELNRITRGERIGFQWRNPFILPILRQGIFLAENQCIWLVLRVIVPRKMEFIPHAKQGTSIISFRRTRSRMYLVADIVMVFGYRSCSQYTSADMMQALLHHYLFHF